MPESDPRLGHIPVDGSGRDAVHIAVVPMIVRERIALGQHIDVMPRVVLYAAGISADCIGIVDPFVAALAFDGDRICMFLWPYTITGLAYHSTHPTLADTAQSADPGRQRSAARRGNDARRRTGGRRVDAYGGNGCAYREPGARYWSGMRRPSRVCVGRNDHASHRQSARAASGSHYRASRHPARRPFLLRKDHARNVARSCARTYSRRRDCDMPISEMIDARD